MEGLTTLDDAIAAVLSRVSPLEPEEMPLAEAGGRGVATAAVARVDLPPFASSAMDGFALRSADTPGALRVTARIAAGRPASGELGPGEAMAIATGGVVPAGADAVVPIENVNEDADRVEVPAVRAGAHVRLPGGDVRAGDEVVAAGVRLGPAQLGALAAAGVDRVTCTRRPRAAVLATGTELRPVGVELGPGEIYDSNGTLLAAALDGAGCDVDVIEPVADDEAAHREALVRALEGDLVVTSGGVSVGPHDLVRAIATELGVEEVFWRVAVKPGKPVSFGARGRTLLFGLPGNPVSTLVGFELFVRPAVRALQGERDPGPRWDEAPLARALRRDARDQLVRARRTPAGLEPVTGQESHMIVRAAEADALALVPRGDGELAAGSAVRYLRLG